MARQVPGIGLCGRDDAVRPPPGADDPLDVRRRAASATSSSRCSVSGVATRVIARTLAYDTAPRCIAALISGRPGSALATRTFSRAAPRSMPVRQFSQCAHDRKPLFQPRLFVEVAQHDQQLVGGGVDARGQFGDRLAERVDRASGCRG